MENFVSVVPSTYQLRWAHFESSCSRLNGARRNLVTPRAF